MSGCRRPNRSQATIPTIIEFSSSEASIPMNIVALGAEQADALVRFFGRLPSEDLTLMRKTSPNPTSCAAGRAARRTGSRSTTTPTSGPSSVRRRAAAAKLVRHVGGCGWSSTPHRRAGIGRTLARHAVTDAVRAGRRKVVVELAADQERAGDVQSLGAHR
jgi:hypothetical protein